MTSELIIDVDRSAIADVPHIDQWCGAWAIEPSRLQMLTEAVRSLDLRSHLQGVTNGTNEHVNAMSAGGEYYADYTRVIDGVAIIYASGPMMKHRASMGANVSTVAMRRSLRMASNDPNVRAILLCIDSPGGTVAGTQDLAAEIAAAAGKKPTHCYIEDLGASAAYWTASQADHVSAGSTALVGSIGTFAVVEDWSKYAEDKGVKVHVVKAGEFKGAGAPGTQYTDAQLANMQRTIDGLNEHFLAGVAAGRKLSLPTVRELNDGRVHLADAAKDLKMIDAVETFDEAFDRLNHQTNSQRSLRMSTNPTSQIKAEDDDKKTDDDVVKDEKKDETKPAEDDKATAAASPQANGERSELRRYMSSFGDAAGAKFFAEGVDYPTACERHIASLGEQVKAANARADAAEEKLESLSLGESEAVETGQPAKGEEQKGTGWSSLFKAKGE